MGATSSLAKTVPIVSSNPGSTPNAVQLNGVWNATTNNAHYVITKSDALNFSEYVYRYCAGTKYDADTASKLANISTLTLDSKTGLDASGLSIAVKCFVVVDTGNEKGSNTVVITRP